MSIQSVNPTVSNVVGQNSQANSQGIVTSTPLSNVKIKEQLEEDKVELSNPKEDKKLSKTQKFLFGAGAAVATALMTAALIAKHKTNQLKKLYNEKLVLSDLNPHIDFKEAKTIEEGIDFAKNVLKIPEVDKNFTLEGINYANKGLVEVSNANKGHLFLPRRMIYKSMDKDNTVAYVIRDIHSNQFGTLAINNKFFDNDILDKHIKKILGYDKTPSGQVPHNVDDLTKYVTRVKLQSDMKELYKKFVKDPRSLSITEKRELYYTLLNAGNVDFVKMQGNPIETFIKLLPKFSQYGVKVDVEAFKKLGIKEQSTKLKELIVNLQVNSGKRFEHIVPTLSPTGTIHHELGHLQDFAKNLKDLDLSSISSLKNAMKLSRKYGKDAEKVDILANRWKGLTYDNLKDVFTNRPEVFKQKYPDLYEFLTDRASQEAAGKVSQYATTSIGEFIAETYGKMVRGDKIPEDVMTLYKKYNGPLIPFS